VEKGGQNLTRIPAPVAGSNVLMKGRRLVDLARADGMQIILDNPIHTLETTTTGCHAEAQTTCDLEENHDPGRISGFPLDRAAIREPASGMQMAATEAGHMSAPDDTPVPAPKHLLLRIGRLHMLQKQQGLGSDGSDLTSPARIRRSSHHRSPRCAR
jgi:hypothetical protein